MNEYKIYLLTFEDGSVYIGKTCQKGNGRFSHHKGSAFNKSSKIYHFKIYQHWRKCKNDPIEEILEKGLNNEKATILEHDYTLAYMQMGYNVLNERIGLKTNERLKKIFIDKLSKRIFTENTFAQMSEKAKKRYNEDDNHPFKQPFTEEKRNNIRKALTGKYVGQNAFNAKPIEYWEEHATTKPHFKETCERMGWDFDKFELKFSHSDYDENGKVKRTKYFYFYKGYNTNIRKKLNEKTIEDYSNNSCLRYHFKQYCKNHNLNFEDFDEIFAECQISKDGVRRKRYFYKPKEKMKNEQQIF